MRRMCGGGLGWLLRGMRWLWVRPYQRTDASPLCGRSLRADRMLACRPRSCGRPVSISSWVFRTKSRHSMRRPSLCRRSAVPWRARICPPSRPVLSPDVCCGFAGVAPSASTVGGGAAGCSGFCRCCDIARNGRRSGSKLDRFKDGGIGRRVGENGDRRKGGGCRCRHNNRGHTVGGLGISGRGNFRVTLAIRRLVRRHGGRRGTTGCGWFRVERLLYGDCRGDDREKRRRRRSMITLPISWSRRCCFCRWKMPRRTSTSISTSPGGSVTAGLAVYDTMQFVTCDVNTYCMGIAASMAAILLCAGNQGQALRAAQLRHHDPPGFGRRAGSGQRC